MVEYCQEKSVWQRGLLLRHFGKVFEEKCGQCDNCANAHLLLSRDMSREGEIAVALVEAFEDLVEHVTVGQCVAVELDLIGEDSSDCSASLSNLDAGGTDDELEEDPDLLDTQSTAISKPNSRALSQ
ncbi:hypothetical protein C8R47DRAFT_1084313 [Mycena vitilis]|nr:hypothetical protein C8R47DRAFT_1085183 [Mycena vitilis]KAJ6450835.1 hypothetical protein C8R47DRAFT_1084303 [Mycena vitilis]KAJ6450848.1 hypothetical protein C8R47DRAFT_1084313 [Mycena vitilis]